MTLARLANAAAAAAAIVAVMWGVGREVCGNGGGGQRAGSQLTRGKSSL